MYVMVHYEFKQTVLRKNHLIPKHPHCKRFCKACEERPGKWLYIGLCSPFLTFIYAATVQKHKLELWYEVPYHCHNPVVSTTTTTNSDTLYIPHFQLPSRPQEAYWWQHLGPCLHHQDQSAQGKRRSPHCKDLWQVYSYTVKTNLLC